LSSSHIKEKRLSESRRNFIRKAALAGTAGAGALLAGSVLGIPAEVAAATDQLVKIDSSDTTADFLNNKLATGIGISKSVANPGGNEQLSIAATSSSLVTPASQVVWRDAIATYRKDGTSGVVTSYTGTTRDLDAIQAAINALTNGGLIFIKAGTYTIASTIAIPSNMLIEGEGVSTIISMTGNNPVFSSTNGTNWIVRNLQVQGGGNSNSNAHGFQFTDPTDCSLEDIWIYNCRNALDITAAWHLALTRITIGSFSTGNQNYVGIYTYDPAQGAGDNSAIVANGVS